MTQAAALQSYETWRGNCRNVARFLCIFCTECRYLKRKWVMCVLPGVMLSTKFDVVGTAKHVGWIQLWFVLFLICMEFKSELAFRWCKSRYVTWAFLLSLFENIVRYNNRLTNCSCTWYSAVDSTYYTVTGHCSCWCRLQSWAMSPCRSFTFNQSFREMPDGTVSCNECHKLLFVHRAVWNLHSSHTNKCTIY